MLALGASHCRKHERAVDPPAVPTAIATAAAVVCAEAESRCVDGANVEKCQGNTWQTEACGDRPCVAGGCAALTSGALSAAREQLLAPLAGRYVNAWTSYGPLPDKALDDLLATADGPFGGDPTTREARCAAEGFVAVDHELGQRPGIKNHLLTGFAISGTRQHAVLRLGAQGHVRVWIRGALVADRDTATGDRPFPDELLAPVELEPGLNPVAVVVSQTQASATGFWLRFGAPDGSLIDYRWALSHGLACSLASLAEIELHAALLEHGFAPRVDVRLAGMAPVSEPELAIKLLQAPNKALAREPIQPIVLADKRFAVADLVKGAGFDARIGGLGKPSVVQLSAEVGARESDKLGWQLHHRGELGDRLARLAARYLDGDRVKLPAALNEDSRASFEHQLRLVVSAAEEPHAFRGSTPHSLERWDNPHWGDDLGWLTKRVKELDELAAAIDAGKDPYEGKTGVVYRAYRSPLDGQLQPYVTFIPPRVRQQKAPLPLIVIYHGLYNDPALALRIAVGAGPKETEDRSFASRHMPFFPDFGPILVAPGGYKDPGQRTIGEEDVLAVIARMKKLYRVDEHRVSITGYSLGGTVSFTVPLHYPTMFSAAAPLCGYPNLTSYWDVANAVKQPFEQVMLDKRFIGNYVENGMHLPLHIVHGAKDGPQRSAVIADRYRALGYSRIFDIEKDLGHNVWDEAYEDGKMVAWLRMQRRPDRPERVRLRTGEMRYDRSYWLRLIAFDKPDKLAYLDARFVPKSKRFELKTDGAAAFAIDVTGFDATGAVIDGKTIALDPGSGERFFVRGASGFELTAKEPERSGRKRPGVAGPIDDVLRHPLVIVYGTQIAAETEANRLTAEHYASFDSWSGAHYPVRADNGATDDELRGKSLVLIGRPQSNALSERFAADLGVEWDEGALRFHGQRYAGADVGISLIRPHPLDPEQYLVLHAGVGYAGTLASRHLPRQSPDYLVYDQRINVARGGELLGERKVLAGGFFGDDWK